VPQNHQRTPSCSRCSDASDTATAMPHTGSVAVAAPGPSPVVRERPDGRGLDLLREERRRGSKVPVIILTARAEVADKVAGLNAGANDYVTKPFAFEELLARIRAASRSVEQPSASEIVVDDLRLDLLTKVAWRSGRRIDLAPKEWALLELFMRHPNQVLSRPQILNHVWDYSFSTGSNVVDVYVGYLRRKLNRPGLRPMLVTVRGAGYRFVDELERSESG